MKMPTPTATVERGQGVFMINNIAVPARLNQLSGAAHGISILTCTGNAVAAKTHGRKPDGSAFTKGFSAEKFFDHEEVGFADLYSLFEIITTLANEPDNYVIRGRLSKTAPKFDEGRVRRTHLPQKGDEGPCFEDMDRAWVMLDFDKVENPEGLDPKSPEAMEYLLSLLPTQFHGAACIYSLSASAGLTDSGLISGHLWFVFNRPVSNRELKSWLAKYPVDKALFTPTQPHYTASPIFRDGRVDPVNVRNGLLAGGSDVVSVPNIDTSKPGKAYQGGNQGLEGTRGYEAKMALLGDGEGGEGCHGVITPAIASYMVRHGPGADREALKADIRQRAAVATWDRDKHPEEYISHETSDDVLDRSIQDWVDKAMVQGEGYSASVLDNLETARSKVGWAVDAYCDDAIAWYEQRGESLAQMAAGDGSFFGFFGINLFDVMFSTPRHGLAVQVGLGKTAAYLERLPRLISARKNGHCVLIAVPNHRLSQELKRRALKAGIDAEVYLGPAQDDPDQPGETMCRIPKELADFQSAGATSTLCRVCPHRHVCGYQFQRRKKSNVWIAASQVIFRKRTMPIPPVDFLIVDEDPLPGGVEGDNSDLPMILRSDEVSGSVCRAMERLPTGAPLLRNHFEISDKGLGMEIRYALSGMAKIRLPDEATIDEIEHAAETAALNSRCTLSASFYREISNNGPYGMRAVKLEDGVIGIRWQRQRRIHNDFDVPALFADATAQSDATRFIIDQYQAPLGYRAEPYVDEDGSIAYAYDYPMEPIFNRMTTVNAATPHATYRQVLFSGAAAKFMADSTGANNTAKVRRYIEARSVGFARVLMICQLGLEDKLRELGLPPNVETAHFNNIRGRDEWNDVDLLIVIGRTQPPPEAMERQGEALFQAPVKTLGPEYYDGVWVPLTGAGRTVRADRHPDPQAEIMRWGACEAELIQAIGRVRAVNRTAKNPVQIDIINQVPLPDIEITEVLEWDEAQPDPRAVIAGRYGLLLSADNTKGAAPLIAALLPDLFDTANAAKQAGVYSRAETPNRYYLLGVSAREYTLPQNTPLVAVKPPGCRYAVLAHVLRPPSRRPLEDGEQPPPDADINDEGVATYGLAYVLKDIPRRLRSRQTA
jgi:hypothetical protein